jgi:CheY-like chemotaxis protein
MPGMDGFEATRAMRQWEAEHSNKRTMIVALTANALTGDRERCLEAGMDDYISKPFTFVRLEEKINEVHAFRPEYSPDRSDVDPAQQAVRPAIHDTAEADGAVLDSGPLDEIRALQEPGLLEQVIDLYRENTAPLTQRLAVAIESRDCAEVREAAHALKGGSANIGARLLVGLCERLERMGREANLADADNLLRQISDEHQRVIEQLGLITAEAVA